MFCFLFWAPYARTTRYEEAFLPERKKRLRSLRSLGLASLLYIALYGAAYLHETQKLEVYVSQSSVPPTCSIYRAEFKTQLELVRETSMRSSTCVFALYAAATSEMNKDLHTLSWW